MKRTHALRIPYLPNLGSKNRSDPHPSRLEYDKNNSDDGDLPLMRILMVVHDFLPKYYAGTERYTHDLCQELRKEHEVIILAGDYDRSKRPYSYQDDDYNGLKIRRIFLPSRHDYIETYYNPEIEPLFRELLDEFSPDMIHIQHIIYLSLSFVDIADEMGIPVVMTLHDYWLICPMGQLLRNDWGAGVSFKKVMELCHGTDRKKCLRCMCPSFRFILKERVKRKLLEPRELISGIGRIRKVLLRGKRREIRNMFGPVKARLKGENYLGKGDIERREEAIKRIVRKVHMFISPSGFLRERFIEWGVPGSKVIHLENGTEIRPFNGTEDVCSAALEMEGEEREGDEVHEVHEGDELRFGFIGTIRPHKAPHLLLKAVAALKERKRVKAIIYGDLGIDPVYSQYLKKLAKNENVTFLGRFTEEEKPQIYRDMDALVIPSVWYENSPVTVHEAFASGTPVITSDIGGMKELVDDGTNGLLFEPGSAEDLARVMERFIHDEELRENLGKGISHVKSMSEHVLELLKIYDGALKEKEN